jgi:hypothetical protein
MNVVRMDGPDLHGMPAMMALIDGPVAARWQVHGGVITPTFEFLDAARLTVRNAAQHLFDLLTSDDLVFLSTLVYGDVLCSMMAIAHLLEINVKQAEELMQIERRESWRGTEKKLAGRREA